MIEKKEKDLRIKYQDIVYELCRLVDKHAGGHITRGTNCTVDDLVDFIRIILKENSSLIARNSELAIRNYYLEKGQIEND